jgi:hypothetical protein
MDLENGLRTGFEIVRKHMVREWKLTAAKREKEVTGTPIIIRAEGWQRE